MTHEHEKHNMAIKVTNAINQHLILTKRLKDSLNVDELGLSLDVVNELKQVRSFIEQLPVKESGATSFGFGGADEQNLHILSNEKMVSANGHEREQFQL